MEVPRFSVPRRRTLDSEAGKPTAGGPKKNVVAHIETRARGRKFGLLHRILLRIFGWIAYGLAIRFGEF
jgi:hypothetical protein